MAEKNGVLLERLKLLHEYKNDLLEFQDVDFQTYLDNKLIRRAVERTLQIAIEACIDIGQRLIAAEGFRTPESNRDVFTILNQEQIVPDDLLPNLLNMSGFRNLIVHDYARIDDAAVFGILKRHLGDFDRFAEVVVGYLEKE